MSSFFQKLMVDAALRQKKLQPGEKPDYSPYEVAKAYREFKISVTAFLRDVVFILLGISSAVFGLKGFLIPNDFIDGGATGIALLIRQLTGAKLGVMLIVINIPFLLLGLGVIGKNFTIKATLAITGLALAAAFINLKPVTDDKLLVAVFGGFFLGAGIGLTIRGGAVIDGTEVVALYLSKRLGTTVGDIITIINVIIFGVAASLISINTALYAMVTYLAASKTVDFVIEGIEEYTGVTIISSHSEEVKEMIINKLGRGVTLYKGKGGFGKQGHADEKNIIYTVVTRLEISRLNTEIQKIDPNAFVVMTAIKDIKGGMIKKKKTEALSSNEPTVRILSIFSIGNSVLPGQIFFVYLVIQENNHLLLHLKANLLLLKAVLSLTIATAQTEKASEIQRLSKALQFETVSDYDSTTFDPVVYKNFIYYLQEVFPLTHQKLEFKIINEYSLLYYWKGTDTQKAPVLFLGHYDVVPAEASTLKQWTHSPFSGYIDNKCIWGRGAIDDKFQVMALLETTEKLLKENFTPRPDIYFAFGHDEEIGGEQGAQKIAEYFKTKNLEFAMVLDEGGVMLKDVLPGITKTIAFISTAEKGDMNIEMAVYDKGGHSSVPPKETAIDILSKAIIKLNKHPMPARMQEPTIEMLNMLAPHFDGTTGFALRHRRLFTKKDLKKLTENQGTNALIRTVMSTTMLRGGAKENSLPTFAAVNLNVRILQGDSIESVMEYIHKITNDPRIQLTLKRSYHNPSPITPSNGKAWDVLSNTIKESWPDVVISPLVAPGTTDSRHYSSLSKNVFRFIPVTVNNESKEQIHGINERISIEEYLKSIFFYTELIKKINAEF